MQDLPLLDLYACAAQPAGWTPWLDRLAARTGAMSAAIQCFRHDGRGPQVAWQLGDSQTGRAPVAVSAFATSADNPRYERHRLARGLGRAVVTDDDLFDRGEAARERLRQGLAELDLGDFLGALVALPDGHLLGIALHRGRGNAQRFSADDARCLASLTPHVVQACTLGQTLLAATAEIERMRHLADLMRCGLVVCDEQARVGWMNQPARDLVRASPTVLRLDGDALRACQPGGELAWQAALARAVRDPDGRTHHLRLGGRASATGHGTVLAALRAAQPGCGASVVVALTGQASSLRVSGDAWSTLFDLTPAEGRLVAALVGGRTLDEHAATRRITVGTARNQLKKVLAKTGTGRQSELVRLALSSAAAQLVGAPEHLPAPLPRQAVLARSA